MSAKVVLDYMVYWRLFLFVQLLLLIIQELGYLGNVTYGSGQNKQSLVKLTIFTQI